LTAAALLGDRLNLSPGCRSAAVGQGSSRGLAAASPFQRGDETAPGDGEHFHATDDPAQASLGVEIIDVKDAVSGDRMPKPPRKPLRLKRDLRLR
jgi:hypothetical protein